MENNRNNKLIPKLCESFHDTPTRRNNDLFILQAYSLQINCQQTNPGAFLYSSTQAQQQYVDLLEKKLKNIESENRQNSQRYHEIQEKYNNLVKNKEDEEKFRGTLIEKFHHESRNVIVDAAAQLMECRGLMMAKQKDKERIGGINVILGKIQELLQVHNKVSQKIAACPASISINQKIDVYKLEQACKYQQKTIDFLRKQTPYTNQLNEIKLLRHEINRISELNEKLIKKCNKYSKSNKSSPQKPNQRTPQPISSPSYEELNKLKDILEVMQINNKAQQQQLSNIMAKYNEEKDKTYKFKQEKQCLIEFLEEQKEKNAELFDKITQLQGEIKDLAAQKQRSKVPCQKCERQPNLKLDKNKKISEIEEFFRDLKPYPKYFNFMMKTINHYEEKLSLLQEKVCDERSTKDKFMQWSSSVYQFLQKTKGKGINQQQINQHMQDLYTLDHQIQNSKIEKFLRQIKALSIGIEQKQIKEMEIELEEYVLNLTNRNQPIKEVQYEDGSSVACSDTFTEQDLRDFE